MQALALWMLVAPANPTPAASMTEAPEVDWDRAWDRQAERRGADFKLDELQDPFVAAVEAEPVAQLDVSGLKLGKLKDPFTGN